MPAVEPGPLPVVLLLVVPAPLELLEEPDVPAPLESPVLAALPAMSPLLLPVAPTVLAPVLASPVVAPALLSPVVGPSEVEALPEELDALPELEPPPAWIWSSDSRLPHPAARASTAQDSSAVVAQLLV